MNQVVATASRPLFAMYVVWHPAYTKGVKIAEMLRKFFHEDGHRNIVGNTGLSVVFRSDVPTDAITPLPIDWDEAAVTGAVTLVDTALASDSVWSDYVRTLAEQTRTKGSHARLFPVLMDNRRIQLEEQALRWNQWEGSETTRMKRLVDSLTHEFSRMLRDHLEGIRLGERAEEEPVGDLEKIRVFISHSKHDDDGITLSRCIRDWLHEHGPMSSFFDIYDIPPGLSFSKVLLRRIETSAVLALHTDSYSSREWCRREVIEAKRRHVPMIEVDCLREGDRRSVPYLGNVPVVCMNPDRPDRIGDVIGCLLAEVFRTYLWRCRVEGYWATYPNVTFTACPPELISLATLRAPDDGAGSADEKDAVIVYPEPPLGVDEVRLIGQVAPNVRTRTIEQWLEEVL